MRRIPKGRFKTESKDRPLSLPANVTGKLKKEYFEISVFIKNVLVKNFFLIILVDII